MRFSPGFWARICGAGRAGQAVLTTSTLTWVDAKGTSSLAPQDCLGEVDRRRYLFWHTLSVHTRSGRYRIRGLSSSAASEWEDALGKWLEAIRLASLAPLRARLWDAQRLGDAMWAGDHFIRASEFRRTNQAIEHALDCLKGSNWARWRSNTDVALEEQTRAAISDAHARRTAINAAVTWRSIFAFRDLFDSIERNPLTAAQRQACVMADDNNLVLAGAGTGKTSVVLGRIAYLLASKIAEPIQILAVAYNADAASELRERARARLPQPDAAKDVTIRTFHGLGMDVIGAVEGRKPSISRRAEDPVSRDTFVTKTVDQLLAQPDYRRAFLEYGFHHLEPLSSIFDFPTMEAYEQDRDDRDLRTLTGDLVRSVEELRIANWLLVQGVRFTYELKYPIDTADPRHGAYHPDFTIERPGHARGPLFLEHFGVDERGNPPPFFRRDEAERYRQSMAWKRQLHRTHDSDLIETYSHEFRSGALFANLEARLRNADVILNPRSESDCLQELRDSQVVTQTGRLFSELLPLCRDLGTIEDVEQRLAKIPSQHQYRSQLLWALLRPVIAEYDSTLAAAGEIDFAEMLHRAARYIAGGSFRSLFTHILVDEFQDISEPRARLVKALRDQTPNAMLFCVGDDWQSIYRFAGADVSFTSRFSDRIGEGSVVALDRTFRFNDQIGAVASRFVTQNPAQTQKALSSERTVRVPAVSIVATRAPRPTLDRILDRIGAWARERQARYSVRILARYWYELEDVAEPAKALGTEINLDVLVSTVHAAKGLEADFVIVVGLKQGKNGFPAKKVVDPFREFCLPDAEPFEFAEERRLFYVALTRARHRVYLLHDPGDCSVFIRELQASGYPVVSDEFRTNGAPGG